MLASRATLFFIALLKVSTLAFVAPPQTTSVCKLSPTVDRSVVVMAVPKKRTSKMKTRQRKANWFAKAKLQRQRALTLGRSVLKGTSTSFVYLDNDEDEDEEEDEEEEEEEEEGEEEA